jgi:hypothetical protein
MPAGRLGNAYSSLVGFGELSRRGIERDSSLKMTMVSESSLVCSSHCDSSRPRSHWTMLWRSVQLAAYIMFYRTALNSNSWSWFQFALEFSRRRALRAGSGEAVSLAALPCSVGPRNPSAAPASVIVARHFAKGAPWRNATPGAVTLSAKTIYG